VFCYAVDLFNHGYYWEAHEEWERLWQAAGRRGPVADFLKGLIKLAAAGVKQLEGRPAGTRNHARRAAELFRGLLPEADAAGQLAGLRLADLAAAAESLAASPPETPGGELGLFLQPGRAGGVRLLGP
jgi:predicted metal-dependent hydrolase